MKDPHGAVGEDRKTDLLVLEDLNFPPGDTTSQLYSFQQN